MSEWEERKRKYRNLKMDNSSQNPIFSVQTLSNNEGNVMKI